MRAQSSVLSICLLLVVVAVVTFVGRQSSLGLAPSATRTTAVAQVPFAGLAGKPSCRSTSVFAEEEEASAAKKTVFINKFRKPDSPVRIRLARKGKHKAPFYRIVVQDSRRIPNGRFLENVGFYDPLKTTGKVSLNIERIKYWIGVGAKPTQTVARFLELVGIQTA
mmetsp:Transcript_26871/g.37499  ORF Transcript_26871/g.37499 Transcript_26871/m.37499 type:complete len:166 (+) Transcript_26871:63-560(+)|eukprot:CAMPEP_0185264696 /NCGR_PEP_ID=MMETSP1359-20130426/24413_1 /TAXON_ID=552665 /ORGANISM="Bigelowiella longifila, Strain CCMP242" /LENGTH=165 /DNA_ID=CAMNT_0027853463 /DNA_START=62 /DNA_END=559 /DNA_ORIENTATION=+